MPAIATKILSVLIPLIITFLSTVGGIISGDRNQFTFSVDASQTGATLSNPVSNVNIWSIEGNPFVNATANEENNIFDFVEYVRKQEIYSRTLSTEQFLMTMISRFLLKTAEALWSWAVNQCSN